MPLPPPKKNLLFGFVKCHDTRDKKSSRLNYRKAGVNSSWAPAVCWECAGESRLPSVPPGRWAGLVCALQSKANGSECLHKRQLWSLASFAPGTGHLLPYLPTTLKPHLDKRRQSPLFPVQPGSSSMPRAAFGLYRRAFTHRDGHVVDSMHLKSAFKSYALFNMVLCFLFRS